MESETILFESLEKLNIINIDPRFLTTESTIGSGGFGKVLKDQFINQYAAVKVSINYNPDTLIKEILTLRCLNHSSIPMLYGISKKVLKGQEKLGIVFEYINGKTLSAFVKASKPSELQILVHMVELVDALSFTHGVGLIHRDLKPDNIMIDQFLDLKIIDFGISKFTNHSQTFTNILGTFQYMAPELFCYQSDTVLNCSSDKSYVSEKFDVYSLGVIINEIFSGGDNPFNEQFNSAQIMGFWLSGGTFPVSTKIVNEGIKILVSKCTQNEPKNRPTMMEVKGLIKDILRVDYLPCLMDGLINLNERESKAFL
jgi:serine/threonine protein kinase